VGRKKDRGVESNLFQVAHAHGITAEGKGKVAEAVALLHLVVRGFVVYGSPFDGDRSDWIVDKVGMPNSVRLQVKCCEDKGNGHGLPAVPLTRSKGEGRKRTRYQEGEFDFIVGYDLYTDTCYVWSWDEVGHLKRTITICPEAAERWDKITGV